MAKAVMLAIPVKGDGLLVQWVGPRIWVWIFFVVQNGITFGFATLLINSLSYW